MADCTGDPICIKVPEVIGVGECQVVIVGNLCLSHTATELKRVTKSVAVENAVIANGQVLINGVVHKNVEYQTDDNLVASDKFDMYFDCCLTVAGAMAGDQFQTELAEVVVEEDQLESAPRDDVQPGRSTADDDDCEKPTDGYRWLFEKMCVHVAGKVTRDVQITVLQQTTNICPTVGS